MANKYESYEGVDNNQRPIYGVIWEGETFTPQVDHKITSHKFKLYTLGVIQGNLKYAIYAVDGDHKPIAPILCSGEVSPSDAETESPGALYEIDLGAGADLVTDQEYAAIASYPNGDATHYIRLRFNSGGEYTRGRLIYTDDGGETWTAGPEPGADYLFEEWGTVGPPPTSRGYIAG